MISFDKNLSSELNFEPRKQKKVAGGQIYWIRWMINQFEPQFLNFYTILDFFHFYKTTDIDWHKWLSTTERLKWLQFSQIFFKAYTIVVPEWFWRAMPSSCWYSKLFKRLSYIYESIFLNSFDPGADYCRCPCCIIFLSLIHKCEINNKIWFLLTMKNLFCKTAYIPNYLKNGHSRQTSSHKGSTIAHLRWNEKIKYIFNLMSK